MYLVFALLVGCGSSDREGDDAGECTDGADNDQDGDFDCDDDDCEASPDCEGGDDDDDDDVVAPPVPDEFGDLLVYLYTWFDNPTARRDAIAALEPLMLAFDVTQDFDDRAYRDGALLDATATAAVTVPDGVDAMDQQMVGLVYNSPVDLETHVSGMVDPNQVCLESDSVKYHNRTFVSDASCFANAGCNELATTAESRRETALEKIWSDPVVDFYRLQHDGRSVVVARGHLPEVAVDDNNQNERLQDFELSIWIESSTDPSETLRMTAHWFELNIGGVGDDFALDLLLTGIEDRFLVSDDFLEGGVCANDRAYDPVRE